MYRYATVLYGALMAVLALPLGLAQSPQCAPVRRQSQRLRWGEPCARQRRACHRIPPTGCADTAGALMLNPADTTR
jgi:hypothetical protein